MAIRNLGMIRRRTRYRTALGASKQMVSDFWVIFRDGPKRQRELMQQYEEIEGEVWKDVVIP